MNAEQAVKLAESKKGLQAILIHGMHVVAGRKAIEKAESRGVEFSYLYLHEGKIVGIPNYDERS